MRLLQVQCIFISLLLLTVTNSFTGLPHWQRHTTQVRSINDFGPDIGRQHFIRSKIQQDLQTGKHSAIITRFPPEPNGFLHLGHAKAIHLNFGMARDFGGFCYLRFDDTNPDVETIEYMTSIIEDVKWLLGGEESSCLWKGPIRYTSDYFDIMFQAAIFLIKQGHAYIDYSSSLEMQRLKGTLTEKGVDSPYRNMDREECLTSFHKMSRGEYEDGEAPVLRAKIDMQSPNLILRDPVIYRMKKTCHPITNRRWNVYPLYDMAHPIADAVEGITHSLCTLEFVEHAPLYRWVIQNLETSGLLPPIGNINTSRLIKSLSTFVTARPLQMEYSRLNVQHNILSKSKLSQLINEQVLEGWADPRLLTISALRKKGVPAEALRLFTERIGVSKVENNIQVSVLEGCCREVLEKSSPRVFGVIDPLKVTVTNWPINQTQYFQIPLFPSSHYRQQPNEQTPQNYRPVEQQFRNVSLSRELFIERSDFMLKSGPEFFGLVPGRKVRLKYGIDVFCEDTVLDDRGEVIEVRVRFDDSKQRTAKVRGRIHWVDASSYINAQVSVFHPPFQDVSPDLNSKLDPASKSVIKHVKIESSVSMFPVNTTFQFERLGYYKLDHIDLGTYSFNQIVGLKSSFFEKQHKEN